MFLLIVIISLVSPLMIEKLGVSGVFVFYSIATFLGLVYQYFFIKETSFKRVADGSIVELTELEKKKIYLTDLIEEESN